MIRKIFALASLLMVFVTLFSSFAYAGDFLTGTSGSSGGFDVSIDRARVNGKVVAESKTNLVDDADVFSLIVDFTAVKQLEKGHVEAVLRARQSSDTVADSTGTFDLAKNTSSTVTLNLYLVNSMKSEPQFDLTIKVIDVKGRVEQKTYGISTEHNKARGILDISIDRVKVNDKIVAAAKTNFIEESNDFDVLVEFTALEDLKDARVEAVLKDLRSGFVVADSSPNFDLDEDTGSTSLLRLELIDKLKQSDSFELTVKIIDAENEFVQKVYGLSMRDGVTSGGSGSRALDISIDSVEIEKDIIAENEDNFLVIGENDKQIDLNIKLTSLEDIKDAHVDAVLSFENGNVVADATATFDIADGENVVKKLELSLTPQFAQANFGLKVKVVDAEGDFEEKFYGLKISRSKSQFLISSIEIEPEGSLDAGKHAVATVNFENTGLVSLNGLTATVSIPELDVSVTKFIGGLDTGEKIVQDFMLKIPEDAETGTYTLRSEVNSQFNGMLDSRELPVSVTGLSSQDVQFVGDKLVINVPLVKQDMRNDGTEVVYQVALSNKGPDANTYTLMLDGLNWANLRLSDSNTFVLNPNSQKTIIIFASTEEEVLGEQMFLVTVQTPEKVLKQVTLKANVLNVSGAGTDFKTVVVVVLIVLVFGFVVAGLFYIVGKLLKGGDESPDIPNESEGEAYY